MFKASHLSGFSRSNQVKVHSYILLRSHCKATPHQSTGETLFYLMYGREHNLPTALNFHVPVKRFPVVETHYSAVLETKLKYAQSLAKKNL